MTLGEIIKEYRTERHMSMEAFGRLIGVSKQYISFLEKNENPSTGRPIKPTYEKIAAVARVIGVPMDDLIARLDGETTISLVDVPDIGNMPHTNRRPRLGAIACGEPILAEQNIEGYDEIPDYIKCDFTLVCRGDSMVNARIYDGDVVCVKAQETAENGQIAVVLIGEEATLKRVRYQGDSIVLWPENPAYAPMIFTGGDVNNIKILGIATHFISKVI